MTSPTLPQIVEDLSEAQKRIVRGYFDPPGTLSSASSAMLRKGLIEYADRSFRFRLTPFGEEVRTHLLSLGEGM